MHGTVFLEEESVVECSSNYQNSPNIFVYSWQINEALFNCFHIFWLFLKVHYFTVWYYQYFNFEEHETFSVVPPR